MKTPFDVVLRTLERDMDTLKLLIRDATIRLDEMETLHERLKAKIAREQKLSSVDWEIYAVAYLDRARHERRQLEQLRQDAQRELLALQEKAASQYAKISAIQTVADTYREEARAQAQRAEQNNLDDLSAAQFLRRARFQRRSRLG